MITHSQCLEQKLATALTPFLFLYMLSDDQLLNFAYLADDLLEPSVFLGAFEHICQEIDGNVKSTALLTNLEHQIETNMFLSSGALTLLFITAGSCHPIKGSIYEWSNAMELTQEGISPADKPTDIGHKAIRVSCFLSYTDR